MLQEYNAHIQEGMSCVKIDRSEMNNRIYNAALNDGDTSRKKDKHEAVTYKDKLEISDRAKGYSAVNNMTEAVVQEITKPVSSEKLMKLRSDVASGNYNVSGKDIAEAIIGQKK
jgi:anti-sigma28 factor (negative regulator of flagellin synthesis)